MQKSNDALMILENNNKKEKLSNNEEYNEGTMSNFNIENKPQNNKEDDIREDVFGYKQNKCNRIINSICSNKKMVIIIFICLIILVVFIIIIINKLKGESV